jgi:hypothetical protein
MADDNSNTTETAESPSTASSEASLQTDPFEHLHKMSTTAGLGSGDYVAINGTAIVAILLGVSSAIVLFNSWLLVTIPLLGVICAAIAFVQISRSNGTQTGRAVATIGLLLCLGFGGFYVTKTIYAFFHNRTDDAKIVTIIHQLSDTTKVKDYAAGYALLDDGLKARVTMPMYEGVFGHVTHSPVLGTLQYMDWNRMISFDVDQVTGERVANGMVKLKYTNSPQFIRTQMSFRDVNGKWYIDQIPSFFPETPNEQPRQGLSSTRPVYGPMAPAKPH